MGYGQVIDIKPLPPSNQVESTPHHDRLAFKFPRLSTTWLHWAKQ